MRKPTFWQGVLVALILSFISGVLFFVASPIFGKLDSLRLVIALLSLLYIGFLLHNSKLSIGKFTVILLWFVLTAVTWLFIPSVTSYLLVHVIMIWLVRSFYYHSSVITSVADLVLSAISVAAAYWAASQSNSLFLASWCFFLVQALSFFIPASWQGVKQADVDSASDRFSTARHNADAALRKIASTDFS